MMEWKELLLIASLSMNLLLLGYWIGWAHRTLEYFRDQAP